MTAAPRTRLGLVSTGGTIVAEKRHGVVQHADRHGGQVRSWVAETGADVVAVSSPFDRMSENLLPSDWVDIAEACHGLVEEHLVDLVLVLHGTDTMTYSAAALSFMLADTQTPVVLTGSNIPYDVPGSDAATNIAAATGAGAVLPPGVFLAFAGAANRKASVHLGTRVRKIRAGGQAYHSIGSSPVATVEPDGQVDICASVPSYQPPAGDLRRVRDSVMFVQSYPGLDFDALREAATVSGTAAVVLTVYPAVTVAAPSGRYSAPSFAGWCADQGILLVAAPPEPPELPVDDYESALELRKEGAVVRHDILPETAYVKLAWALGVVAAADGGLDDTQRLFEAPIAGEFIEGSTEETNLEARSVP